MAEIDMPSLKERLWQKMQGDLAQFIPEITERNRLMCCACGRFLSPEDFDVDHMIPRQTIKCDPEDVRNNPETPANVRAGNILLCTKPLHYRNSRIHNNGCNSWKGKYYDGPMTEIFTGKASKHPNKHTRNAHIIGGLMLAYLAMVAEFGYIVALMRSGLLLREQFFNPTRFHKALRTRFQVIFTGQPVFAGQPPVAVDHPVWARPFTFKFEDQACRSTVRNFVVSLPVSQNPTAPIAHHLRFVPQRYAFRPNFQTFLT
jgi:hypothetical protein